MFNKYNSKFNKNIYKKEEKKFEVEAFGINKMALKNEFDPQWQQPKLNNPQSDINQSVQNNPQFNFHQSMVNPPQSNAQNYMPINVQHNIELSNLNNPQSISQGNMPVHVQSNFQPSVLNNPQSNFPQSMSINPQSNFPQSMSMNPQPDFQQIMSINTPHSNSQPNAPIKSQYDLRPIMKNNAPFNFQNSTFNISHQNLIPNEMSQSNMTSQSCSFNTYSNVQNYQSPFSSNTVSMPTNLDNTSNFNIPHSSTSMISSTFQSDIPPPPISFPTNFNMPPPKIIDKNSIDYWNQKWQKNHDRSSLKNNSNYKVSISDYKEKVANLSTQIKELEKLTTHLQIMCKSLNEDEWSLRKTLVEKQKINVEKAMDELKIIPLPEIKYQLKRRQSKRKRLKRKREEYKEMKKENKVICQLEHSRIDAWLEKMKEQVERTRREEDIKKEADYVLSEVFHKKAEAKRMLTLLTTLGKLRNARIHDRESKGEFVSKEAAQAFNKIIESLKKRWIDQINDYNIEEKGLRVMLEDAETKRSNVEKSLNKQILQHWLKVIFGEKPNDNTLQPSNIQELISVRSCWDQFITTDENSFIVSSIPNGWIIPTPPSDDLWATFLKP